MLAATHAATPYEIEPKGCTITMDELPFPKPPGAAMSGDCCGVLGKLAGGRSLTVSSSSQSLVIRVLSMLLDGNFLGSRSAAARKVAETNGILGVQQQTAANFPGL